MKMKITKHSYKAMSALFLASAILIVGCKKDLKTETVEAPSQTQFLKPIPKVNPFSITNIHKAQATLAAQGNLSKSAASQVDEVDRQFEYIKFDPSNVTGEMLQILRQIAQYK